MYIPTLRMDQCKHTVYLHRERVSGYAECCLVGVRRPLVGQDQRDGVDETERDPLQAVEEEEDHDVELVSLQVPQHAGLGPQFGEERLWRADVCPLLRPLLLVVVVFQVDISHFRVLAGLGVHHHHVCCTEWKQNRRSHVPGVIT